MNFKRCFRFKRCVETQNVNYVNYRLTKGQGRLHVLSVVSVLQSVLLVIRPGAHLFDRFTIYSPWVETLDCYCTLAEVFPNGLVNTHIGVYMDTRVCVCVTVWVSALLCPSELVKPLLCLRYAWNFPTYEKYSSGTWSVFVLDLRVGSCWINGMLYPLA